MNGEDFALRFIEVMTSDLQCEDYNGQFQVVGQIIPLHVYLLYYFHILGFFVIPCHRVLTILKRLHKYFKSSINIYLNT
jgi:hypothetical protein